MKMHFVISVIHLKQTKKSFYEKKIVVFKIFDSKSIMIQKQSHYVMKKILSEKSKNDLFNFMIKWKKYDEITWKNEKKNAEKHFKNDQKISNLKKALKFFNSFKIFI